MSFLKHAAWFLKGMKEYTKSGYEKAAKNFCSADLDPSCSLSSHSYMVTGANSGIGKIIAKELAQRGGTVHLVCRNADRGKTAADEIKEETKNDSVYLHIVDLAKPVEVYKFAKKFSENEEQLDVLVNNAGCMVHERVLDQFGFESNFSTNTLAVYILTETLLPLIEKSSDPRVVTVSSGGMLTEKLNLSDLQSAKVNPFSGLYIYAQHKRQQVIMMEEYGKTTPHVKFSTMHPGWADTPAVKQSMPWFYEKMKTRLRTPEQGADTAVWLAASPTSKEIKNGEFFQDRAAVSKHLPLSWTSSSAADQQALMSTLSHMYSQVKIAADSEQ